MRIIIFFALLAVSVFGQTGDLIWCPATENYLNHQGSSIKDIGRLESLEACQQACDESEDGCNFVWFRPDDGTKKSSCKLLKDVERFKPRLFESKGMTYNGRLCIQDDPRILPCDSDFHCYETDYCAPDLKNCEPKCNLDTICDPCESCYDLEDRSGAQECRADASKCPLTAEPTTPEPTEETEEPTEATPEPTDATEEPTLAPTPVQWCPTTDKYFNHNGEQLGDEVMGLDGMEPCKDACDNAAGCNFVWYFEPQGKKASRCRLFSGAVFLKPRQSKDQRAILYAGRLCGVSTFTIFCSRPTHCYETDTCNYDKEVCEPGLDSPLRSEEENSLMKVDTDQFSTNSELGFFHLLFATVGVAAVFYGGCRALMVVLFDDKNYAPVPGQIETEL